jgi:two-component system response regulator YesN
MIKIFLAEDEVVVRNGIKHLIAWPDYGFEFAGEAPDGEIAWTMIQAIRPDVLITDVRMPFMDGLTLSRLVRKELPKAHILILSGYDDFQYAQEALNIGIEQYLLKPITRERLMAVLEEIRETILAEQSPENGCAQSREDEGDGS